MDEKISDLQQLRIHELRDLARKMGVNAPTSKKKEEIIDEIMKIMNGESIPFSNITKKGRPVRNTTDNFDVVDFILPNKTELQSFNEYKFNSDQDKLQFMVNMNHAEYGDINLDEVRDREGVVEVKEEGFGVLHVSGFTSHDNDVFINPVQIKQFKLKNGEIIKIKSRKVKENYPEVAFEISKAEQSTNNNFDDFQALPLSKKISLNSPDLTEFYLGGRYYVDPSYDSYKEVVDIAKELQKNKDIVVETLYLNAMIDKLPITREININQISFNKSDEDVINGTNLFFERMKRIAETGKHVVCVVNEISQYAKSNNNVYLKSGRVGEISNKTAFLTKALLSNAKYTGNGSITIIAVDPLKLPSGIYDLFKYDILPIFHNVLK